MIDHLVFFAVREGASQEEVDDLVSSIRGLQIRLGFGNIWSILRIWPSLRSSTLPRLAASSSTTNLRSWSIPDTRTLRRAA